METRVGSQLRMERCGKQMPLLRGNDPLVIGLGEHLRFAPHRLDDRSTDEDGMVCMITSRHPLQPWNLQVRFERFQLPSEGIAFHCDIHQV